MSKKYRIFFLGKFHKIHDEEYIARSFEMLGHEVFRCETSTSPKDIELNLNKFKPSLVLFNKWSRPKELDALFERLKREGVVTVCWVFDLYWGYPREHQIHTQNFFRADYVFTTDGGHDKEWKSAGINHHTVRQGIYKDECYLLPPKYEINLAFVGSESPLYPERTEKVMQMMALVPNSQWLGRNNTDEVRGIELNKLFSKTKVVIGDSFPSPNYWSNRVVETLGRGGFLIHREVDGLKEDYPHLVTYNGSATDLKNKIKYYLSHGKEREDIREMNHRWVKDHYTMDKQCQKLLNFIS